eukprot:3403618-Pyramimonas_sp.AAC.1
MPAGLTPPSSWSLVGAPSAGVAVPQPRCAPPGGGLNPFAASAEAAVVPPAPAPQPLVPKRPRLLPCQKGVA